MTFDADRDMPQTQEQLEFIAFRKQQEQQKKQLKQKKAKRLTNWNYVGAAFLLLLALTETTNFFERMRYLNNGIIPIDDPFVKIKAICYSAAALFCFGVQAIKDQIELSLMTAIDMIGYGKNNG